jgi:hypothetical protein
VLSIRAPVATTWLLGRQDLEVHGDELLAPDLRAWADAAEANARRRRGII